jgi:lipopolysaccharide/colanic/teichoic acid biosynthesis glycosyltransferase
VERLGSQGGFVHAVKPVSTETPTAHSDRLYRIATRYTDVVVSASALAVFAPLMLMIALAIRRDSHGPVLFRHQRAGFNRRDGNARRRQSEWRESDLSGSFTSGDTQRTWERLGPRRSGDDRRDENRFGEPFDLYKFRTMFHDARERFPALYSYQHSAEDLHELPIKVLVGSDRVTDGVESDLTLGADPRLSRVGRWLRRTSLDELPNFINVLRGEMTLVGPRPDIPENIRYYRPEHMCKFDVKPGITGLAQIKGRGTLSLHATNEWDIEYIRKRSFWLDIKILLSTVRITFKSSGAF